MVTNYTGMRSSDDFTSNQLEPSYRGELILRYKNIKPLLTAMTAGIKHKKETNYEYKWWEEDLPTQRATVTGIYTDVILSSAYTSGGVEGDTLYFKMSAADSSYFRPRHQVLLRDASDYAVDVNGKVTDVVSNGASSYIAVKLLEDDDNSNSHDLSDCDTALIIGNINADGAAGPDALSFDPTELSNYTQTFRNAVDLTRRAIRAEYRTGDALKEERRRVLLMHMMEIEKAFLFGVKTRNVGSNGKYETTTMGMIPMIKTYASANTDDYVANPSYAGQAWTAGGENWLDSYLEIISRHGSDTKMAFIGSGALMGLNSLAKAGGMINLGPDESAYGFRFKQYNCPQMTLLVKQHPLFSWEATNRYSMLIFEPELLEYVYIDDTHLKKDTRMLEGGQIDIDGRKEEWLTDAGLIYHDPEAFGFLTGIGQANTYGT